MSHRIPFSLAMAIGAGCIPTLLGQVYAQEANQLTTDEAAAGYDLLFNGVDLNNWHAYRLTDVTDAWTVKTNAPLGPRIENGNGNKLPILTDKKFTNFDLKIDVQTPVNGNSGVFTRYEEVATQSGNARSGPETQVCGPSHSDCASPKNGFGASYDMFQVKESLRTTWYNAPGSWNQLRIIAYDSNYVHYGNGKKLLEYKIGTPEYVAAYNASKYVSDGNNGRYYHIHPGGFLLQHHGETGITFRNIKAKELTVHPFKKDFPDGKWPDTLSQSFVLEKTAVSLLQPAKARISVGRAHKKPSELFIQKADDPTQIKLMTIDGRRLKKNTGF
jgi:Domain of Unknown Function (DUF1080)